MTEVLEQIARTEPRPPRQIDDTIPKELERICLKALAKRASERYTTARDLADDLRHFLQTDAASGSPATAPGTVSPPPGSTQEATPTAPTPRRPDSDRPRRQDRPQGPAVVRPARRRLLPRAAARPARPRRPAREPPVLEDPDRDDRPRHDLPRRPDLRPLGLRQVVAGQGGACCPGWRKHVLPVYVEATPEETEARLLRGAAQGLPRPGRRDSGLVESLAALRRGRVLRPGQKVLLVLDQFEQWLFARRGEEDTELVAALRQCDGEHVQAIVLVRDDFWMAATRFMSDLEIRPVEGENSAAVDLFDLRHARKVLAAFGRAYGVLPERAGDLTPEQQAFLDQAVAGLAQDGKVISVRLALFAEMVKGKPWTPATLREVGGTEGVGVTFLEETFGSPQAHPEAPPAPEGGAGRPEGPAARDAAPTSRARCGRTQELRDASGYADRPRDFDDLLRILDAELRLITPTDPEGSTGEGQPTSAGRRALLPAHPRLPGPLAARLADPQAARDPPGPGRAAAGRTRGALERQAREPPPAVALEWANIRLLTRRKDWTEPAAPDDEAGGPGPRLAGAGAGRRRCLLLAAGLASGTGSTRRTGRRPRPGWSSNSLKADTRPGPRHRPGHWATTAAGPTPS